MPTLPAERRGTGRVPESLAQPAKSTISAAHEVSLSAFIKTILPNDQVALRALRTSATLACLQRRNEYGRL
jgi:hypothetical protein